ncbi:diguanylate cyclase [Marinobacter sp. X15-166B]|uniref:sensor domain-containing diguanylate cyclase n=1 Tax=Marinobacter sp. X15-166B TaxID=1897620 RepID=UPI002244B6C9|nr:diguanylate cyclase [Marinobacter sp. X15-166B]
MLGRIEFVNPAFEQMFGLRYDEVTHRYLLEYVFSGDREAVARGWADSQNRGRIFRTQLRVPHQQDGRLIWVDVMTAPIESPDKTLGTITVARNITHELEVKAQLKAEQQRAESILGVLQEGVVLTDRAGVIRYANRAVCAYLNVELQFGQTRLADVVAITSDDQPWSLEDFLDRDRVDSLDVVIGTGDGRQLESELTMLRLPSEGDYERLVFVLRDDRDRRRNEQRLTWEASHDSLTGLLNRRAFWAVLGQQLAECGQSAAPTVLMMVDLDGFKPVNDRGGHLLGDELLRRLAAVLTGSVRQTDAVARLGGDEFAVVLPACGLERAQQLAEQVRADVAALRVEQDGERYGVTCSIGLTELSGDDSGPKATIARADEGLYAAKARGRNCVVVVPLPLSPPTR